MSSEPLRRQEDATPEPSAPDLLTSADGETALRAILRGIALETDETCASSICAVCGKLIEGVSGRVYCSRACSAHARRVRRKDDRIRWLYARNAGGTPGT